MNKVKVGMLVLLLVIGCLSLSAGAMSGGAPPKNVEPVQLGNAYLIDNFESGSLKSPREWWTFDIKKAGIAPNAGLTAGDEKVAQAVGKYSLALQGNAKSWYVGGCGTYLAKEGQDLSKYSSLQIDVYGNGEGSGTVKLELLDDDNKNWQIEQDAAKSYAPMYDDKYSYSLTVDWNGWKRVTIPFADFVDDNPGVGDDVWNPQQKDDSGGVLQVQVVCIAPTDKGSVNYNLDNIYLTVQEK
ncbi:MAG: CIA30 family protein [Candidatus Margulisbacteria bacterium]|nr:CIA30 family protein [Candidatus Margulisiibacteriota bacterium]